jgi:hypothetical protein
MKYLKTFEETIICGITYKYDVGDYVLLNKEEMDKNTIEDHVSPHDLVEFKVKIIEIRTKDEYGKQYPYPYIIETFDNKKCAIKDTEILRKLTVNEIEEYKIKKLSKKYNIL